MKSPLVQRRFLRRSSNVRSFCSSWHREKSRLLGWRRWETTAEDVTSDTFVHDTEPRFLAFGACPEPTIHFRQMCGALSWSHHAGREKGSIQFGSATQRDAWLQLSL